MKQSKISFADVFTLVTALVFGFVCFLGVNFYTLGNTAQCITLSAFIAVLLGGTALGAKFLKRTSRNFKSSFIWEIILVILFTVFTLYFAYSPFPHYFVVSDQKVEIQSKLSTSISAVKNMFAGYEKYAKARENNYKGTLNSVVKAKNIDPSTYRIKYGFVDGTDDDEQIKTKLKSLHARLFPTNYSDTTNTKIKEVAANWLVEAKSTTDSWNPIGIVHVVNEVERNSNDWFGKLERISKERGEGENAEDFKYDLLINNVKTHLTTLGKPTLLSIGLAFLAYALMLLTWIITKRHTRFPGISVIFGKSTGMAGNKKDEIIL